MIQWGDPCPYACTEKRNDEEKIKDYFGQTKEDHKITYLYRNAGQLSQAIRNGQDWPNANLRQERKIQQHNSLDKKGKGGTKEKLYRPNN